MIRPNTQAVFLPHLSKIYSLYLSQVNCERLCDEAAKIIKSYQPRPLPVDRELSQTISLDFSYLTIPFVYLLGQNSIDARPRPGGPLPLQCIHLYKVIFIRKFTLYTRLLPLLDLYKAKISLKLRTLEPILVVALVNRLLVIVPFFFHLQAVA